MKSRHAVEDCEADDRLDAFGAALDDAREPAGTPLEMEAQRKLMHVNEGLVGKLPDGVLANTGEQRIAQLVETGLQQTGKIIGEHQHDGARQEYRQKTQRLRLVVERIRRPLEEIGDEDEHGLGDHQDNRRPDDPQFQIKPISRPHIWPKISYGFDRIGAVGGNRLLLGHVSVRFIS